MLDLVWRKEYLTEDTYKNGLVVCIINSIIVVPTILLNALVIFAVKTQNQLRTNSNILLACLATTDLLTGVVVQPVSIVVQLKRVLAVGPFCPLETTQSIAGLALGFATLSHLVLISIDRYIAIKHPLKYEDIATTQRIKTGVFFTWTFTFLVTIQETVLASTDSKTNIYPIYANVRGILLIIIFSIIICVVIISYGYIYSASRRQKKRLKTEQLSQEEVKGIKKHGKAANTLALILSALVVTYLPVVIAFLVCVFSDSFVAEPHVFSILWSWLITFVPLGSLFNPIIYCWRMKKLRRAFLEILHITQPQNSPPVIEMQIVERHRPSVPPTTSEAFSMPTVRNEPVLLAFRQLQVEEITPINDIL